MNKKRTADIVIIGGGVIGCSTAYNLANQGAKNVVLLEKGDICSGGTSKSCAITRSHYTIEANMHHAVESIKIFENFDQIIGGDPNFQRSGYIILGSEEIRTKMETVFKMQNKYGIDTQVLTPTEAKECHPLMQFDDVDVIGYESRTGYCDPYMTTTSYVKRAKDLGVQFFTKTLVTGIQRKGNIKTVHTQNGSFETEKIIMIAGPWTKNLGHMVGVNFPFTITKHKVLTLKIDMPYQKNWPIVKDLISPEKIYFRPDSGGVVLVGTGDYGEEIESMGLMTDEVGIEHVESIGRSMSNRMPLFEDAQLVSSWTGPYDIPPDWNPIIGPVPGQDGIYVAVGFSGHGFKMAPTIGESLAQQVLGIEPRVPIEMYSMTRFATGNTLDGTYGIGTLG
jgi:sarcosine oxidase subunit beta